MSDGVSTKRYERQMVIPEIGIEGQRKLLTSTVMMLSSLGSLSALILAPLTATGIGRLLIIGSDPCSAEISHERLGSNPDCRIEFSGVYPSLTPDVVLVSGKASDCQDRLTELIETGVRCPIVSVVGGPGPAESLLCGSALSADDVLRALETCIQEDRVPTDGVMFAAAGEVVKAIVGHSGFPPCRAVIFDEGLSRTRELEIS